MKKHFIIIISLFITVFIAQTIIIKRYSNKYSISTQHISNLIYKETELKSKVQLLSHLYEQSFTISGTKLDNILVENDVRKKIPIKELLTGDLKLVYYFNEYSCLACVDEELIRLNEVIDSIGKKNVMIIANFSNYRDFYQFVCRNDIKCDIYNTNGSQFLDAKRKDESIIFTVNNKMIIKKCFIPIKTLSATTRNFYSSILRDYSSVSNDTN